MIDIKFLVKNPDVVRENIKKKFQDNKLPLVDEAINLYTQYCDCQQRADTLGEDHQALPGPDQQNDSDDQRTDCEYHSICLKALHGTPLATTRQNIL